MDLLTDFFYREKVLYQGRGVSEAKDRPIFGCSSFALPATIAENAMPFIPVDETARVTITYSDTAGNEFVNVIHCKSDGFGVTPAALNDLLDGIDAWLEAYWDVQANNQIRAVRLEALDLTAEDSWYISRTIDIQGLEVGNAMPPQDTVAISLRSPYSGRSRRGRLYHVGLNEAQQDGGYIDSVTLSALVTLYENLKTNITGVNWVWGVVSFVSDGVARSEGLFTAISDIIITDNIVDSMDKRKPKV